MAWNVGEKKVETKRTGPGKVVEVQPSAKDSLEQGKERNLAGGMDLLELDFLLSVIENTRGNDKNDVMMRKLSFNELIRREQADTIDSNALKVYAIDKSGLYSKDIQCEAMKVLADRTTRESKSGN
jgi:hypothetical protein